MDPFNPTNQKRPTTLLVLAILTFINSGLSFLSYLFLSISTDYLPQIVELLNNINQPKEVVDLYSQMIDIPGWKFLLIAVCYALSIVGAALMLKLNKIGFHIYVIAQIILFVIANFILKGVFSMNMMSIIWTITFVGLYAIHLKYMKNDENDDQFMYDEFNHQENE